MNIRVCVAVATLSAAIMFACVAPARALPPTCVFNVVSGVSFGNYDVFNAAPTLANGTIVYQCSNFVPAGQVVKINLSRGSAPTFNPRFMKNGAQHLLYNLYLDAGFTKIWGNNTGGSFQYSQNTLNGVATTVTIFGRITAGQDLTAGAYSDTITVTMNW
jgi:spore coat protein U-like protein